MRLILFFFVIYCPASAITLDNAINYALMNNKEIKISSLNIQDKLGLLKNQESIYDINFCWFRLSRS